MSQTNPQPDAPDFKLTPTNLLRVMGLGFYTLGGEFRWMLKLRLDKSADPHTLATWRSRQVVARAAKFHLET